MVKVFWFLHFSYTAFAQMGSLIFCHRQIPGLSKMALVLSLFGSIASPPSIFGQQIESTPASRAQTVAAYLVDEVARHPGIVIATKGKGAGWTFSSRGYLEKNSQIGMGPNTQFEIGSVTKVFIAVLFMDMILKSEVRPEDSITTYLPNQPWPTDLHKITLLHLATHTSGLPRRPTNLSSEGSQGPYSEYSKGDLLQFLAEWRVAVPPGKQLSYSNLGMGLLGFLLSEAANQQLEVLLKSRIFNPLDMPSTGFSVNSNHDLAVPHDGTGNRPVGFWKFDVLAGAGALYSTARDMTHFAEALLGLRNSSITHAAKISLSKKFTIPGLKKAYYPAWLYPGKFDDRTIFYHDGGTGGSRSLLAVEPASNNATIILANAATGVTDFALFTHLPDRTLPVLEKLREIKLKQADAALLTGHYQLSKTETITITLEKGQLFAKITGDGKYPVYPYGTDRLFYRVGEAQLVFAFKKKGSTATSVSLKISGKEQLAPRVMPTPK